MTTNHYPHWNCLGSNLKALSGLHLEIVSKGGGGGEKMSEQHHIMKSDHALILYISSRPFRTHSMSITHHYIVCSPPHWQFDDICDGSIQHNGKWQTLEDKTQPSQTKPASYVTQALETCQEVLERHPWHLSVPDTRRQWIRRELSMSATVRPTTATLYLK